MPALSASPSHTETHQNYFITYQKSVLLRRADAETNLSHERGSFLFLALSFLSLLSSNFRPAGGEVDPNVHAFEKKLRAFLHSAHPLNKVNK